MVQRRVAVGVSDARICAVGEQGHHRFRASMPAVAGRGQQRRHRRCLRDVDIDAALDHATQQTQIGQDRRQHRQAAPVTLAGRRIRARIGAGIQQLQGTLDPATARGDIQLAGQGFDIDRDLGTAYRHWHDRLQVYWIRFVLVVIRHVQHRQAMRQHPRGRGLQQRMGKRQDRRVHDHRDQARVARQQGRPTQGDAAREQQPDRYRDLQAAPSTALMGMQPGKVLADIAAMSLQPMPQRPKTPKREQHDCACRTYRKHL
jgi:hypothetical protein